MAGFIQKGAKNILQKNPNDVVFLSALRTPVTRSKKGGLRDAYDHEMLACVCLARSLPKPGREGGSAEMSLLTIHAGAESDTR